MPDTDPKHVVQRLIADVMNQRNLGALDDLYTPRLALAARRWVDLSGVAALRCGSSARRGRRCQLLHSNGWSDAASPTLPRCTSSAWSTAASPECGGWKTPSSGCASSASTWGIEGHGAVMDAVPTSWQRPASQAARASWMSRRVRMSAAI